MKWLYLLWIAVGLAGLANVFVLVALVSTFVREWRETIREE